jgi:hypothetical protein
MSVSEAFSTVMKIRRVVVIISILAGAGYKVAPMVMHKADAKPAHASEATVKADTASAKTAGRNLGEIALTNHFETYVSLGAGKDCIITPKMLDAHNVQLTLAVESKAGGKTHDLTVTQVVTPEGKPVEVAVGDFNFSLTPSVSAEQSGILH